jgi:hypothetical protein
MDMQQGLVTCTSMYTDSTCMYTYMYMYKNVHVFMHTLEGHAAWTNSKDMQHGHGHGHFPAAFLFAANCTQRLSNSL